MWIFCNYWTPCNWASRSCKGHLELCENLRWFLWWCLNKWSNANHFNIKHCKTLYFTYHYCIHLYLDIVHCLFARLHFATSIQITSGDGLNPTYDSGGRRWPYYRGRKEKLIHIPASPWYGPTSRGSPHFLLDIILSSIQNSKVHMMIPKFGYFHGKCPISK